MKAKTSIGRNQRALLKRLAAQGGHVRNMRTLCPKDVAFAVHVRTIDSLAKRGLLVKKTTEGSLCISVTITEAGWATAGE